MNDLVEVLRGYAATDGALTIFGRAADEIERLRAALEYDKTLFREGGTQRKRDLAEWDATNAELRERDKLALSQQAEIDRLQANLSKWKARAQLNLIALARPLRNSP
jgi:uncharacterized small protein (DUF1192 family)